MEKPKGSRFCAECDAVVPKGKTYIIKTQQCKNHYLRSKKASYKKDPVVKKTGENVISVQIPPIFQPLQNPARYKVLFGGRGCVHGSTRISTPFGNIPIKDFAGGPIYTTGHNGVEVVLVGKPVIYKPEMLYKVTLSSGESVICTAKHKFLTTRGWLSLSSLYFSDDEVLQLVGSADDPQQKYSLAALSESLSDVRHCFQIIVGFLYHYSLHSHLCDEQPQQRSNTYQSFLHKLAYAPEHRLHASMLVDDLDSVYIDAPPLSLSHLSIPAARLAMVAKNYTESGNYNGEIFSGLLSVSNLCEKLSHEKTDPLLPIQALAKQVLAFGSLSSQEQIPQIICGILQSDVDDMTYSDSLVDFCNHAHFTTSSTIKSIEKHGVDVFYDLFVPFFNNYIAEGMIHHNSAKSHSVVRFLIARSCMTPTRILCAREFQNSIRDSCHKLFSDCIAEMKLDRYFDVQQAVIKGPNGSEIAFEGLRHNVTKIKSYEGVDICWIEEAQNVSKTSWEILIPTIRKENSEIWITFNPEMEEDETYQRFVVTPPPNSIVIKANWADNPWFPEVLAQERDTLKIRDPDAYLNVWEGHCRHALTGAIYANELRQAQDEGRICTVPIDMTKPVDTFWDLGWADCTSIWFVQTVGLQIRVIGCYQNQFEPIQHYVGIIQRKKYIYGTHYLPHDARAKQLGTGKSIEETLASLGLKVAIVPMLSVEDGINAARTMFPSVWIDDKNCSDGLSALRRYRYDTDSMGRFCKNPLHDEHSHYADSFRYMSVGYCRPQKTTAVKRGISKRSWKAL